MSKGIVAGLAALVFSAGVFAQDPDFSKVEIKVTKVAGTVYMLEGAGGNIGVSVGDDGVVVVDDQFAPLAEKIEAALKGITDKPVRFVINTHYHGDHVGGNAFFQEKSPIIAQHNVRKRLSTDGIGGNGSTVKFDVKASDAKALPVLTFDHDVVLHLNGEEIRALHLPHGHTDGDSVIFFTKSNVLHMGDDFVTYGFPFIDIDAGGSVRGLIASFEEILPTIPADAKIIPGHGPISTVEDVKKFLAMMKDSVASVERAMKEGKSPAQMKETKILEKWQNYNGNYIKADTWIDTIVNDLSGHKPGEFKRHN